jgi:hypothetical protein
MLESAHDLNAHDSRKWRKSPNAADQSGFRALTDDAARSAYFQRSGGFNPSSAACERRHHRADFQTSAPLRQTFCGKSHCFPATGLENPKRPEKTERPDGTPDLKTVTAPRQVWKIGAVLVADCRGLGELHVGIPGKLPRKEHDVL